MSIQSFGNGCLQNLSVQSWGIALSKIRVPRLRALRVRKIELLARGNYSAENEFSEFGNYAVEI